MIHEYKRFFICNRLASTFVAAVLVVFGFAGLAPAQPLLRDVVGAVAARADDPKPQPGQFINYTDYLRALEEWTKRHLGGSSSYAEMTLAEATADLMKFYPTHRPTELLRPDEIADLLSVAVEFATYGESAPEPVSLEEKILILQIQGLGLQMQKDLLAIGGNS